MKKTICYAFLFLISCGQQKPAESVTVEPVEQDSVITEVSDSVTTNLPAPAQSGLTFEKISIENNAVLQELVNNPFPKDLDALKAMLDSLGVASEYGNGENGGLSYDSADITCNRSYGESICVADIRSGVLALNKNITIGMALPDFLSLTGVKLSQAENVRYEYTHSAQEHNYTMRFDFVNKELIRFYYEKDPCVIYD